MTYTFLPVSFDSTRSLSTVNRLHQILCVCAGLIGIMAFAPKAQAQGVTFTGATQSVNFGSANVCPTGQTAPAPCSNTLTLTYNVAANTTIGSISILTTGAPNLDFRAKAGDTSNNLCSARTFHSTRTCTVDITFAPLAPGQRKGAVQIVDGSGNILANTYIYGTGTGPVITFQPGTQISLQGFNGAAGLAVDGNGNVFVGNITNVLEVIAVNGIIPANPTIKVLLAGSAGSAEQVALDGSGNVFVADEIDSQVKEIVAVGGNIPINPTVKLLGDGFNRPYGVAVDGSGNVYVSDTFNFVVKEILAVNGSIPANPTINTLSSFGEPFGLAVDGSGNVFVADAGDAVVSEILAVNGSIPANPTINPLGNGLNFPISVALDAAGDVFLADLFANEAKEILAVNGSIPASNPTINILGSGFNQPRSVALDGIGNVYVGDATGNLARLDFVDPPSLNFANTAVGSTSTDSPQSITIQNVGNQALGAVAPGLVVTGPNFVQVAGSGTPEDCTSSFTLAPGATCNLSLNFEPQVLGPLTSTAVFTDNTLNASSATQAVQLSGIGVAAAPASTTAVLVSSPNPSVVGQSVTFTATVTATSGPRPTGTVGFKHLGTLLGTATLSNGVASFITSLPSIGTDHITAVYSGSTTDTGSTSAAVAQIVNKAPTTTLLTSTPNPSAVGQPVTFTATVTPAFGGVASGTVSFKHLGTLLGTATLSNGVASFITSLPSIGTDHITAVYSGSTTYSGSTSAAVAQIVNKAPTTTLLTSTPNPSAVGQPVTFTATVTPAFGGVASGTVSFKHLGTLLDTATLSNGVASFTTSTLPAGTAHITAVYSGSTTDIGSTSATLAQIVH